MDEISLLVYGRFVVCSRLTQAEDVHFAEKEIREVAKKKAEENAENTGKIRKAL